MKYVTPCSIVFVGALCFQAAPALALNILLCNDDGITAANARATKQKLTEAGHSVIFAGPIDNQSGRGGYLPFLEPIATLTGKERGAVALNLPAGSAGVGTDPSDPDVSYVNSTPVASCLYGMDVAAPKKWGSSPDLVISGPNEGNNTGSVNPSSGTFNNMVYAVNRGLPAMAISDATTTKVTWSATLATTSRAFEVAGIASTLVKTLQDAAKNGWADGKLMPAGIGLNINIPDFAAGTGASLPLSFTQVGTATAYMPAFYEKFSDSPLAAGYGLNVPVPGIIMANGGTRLPTGIVLPADTNAKSEQNVINTKTAITISPVKGIPDAGLW